METPRLRGGLTFGTTIHPYDAYGKKKNAKMARRKPNAIPGGGPMPLDRAKDKKRKMSNGRAPARSFRQDIMKGDHKFKGGLATGLVKHRAAQKAGETTDYEGQETTGTSIFDPVLAETMIYWFCPERGAVLDPFCGGSTRGVVAGYLGHPYTGIDLSARQLAANRIQWQEIMGAKRSKKEEAAQPTPNWINGDSHEVAKLAAGEYDFVFSCPPYADLEVYSDDPRDISRLTYKEFLPQYRAIVASACALLKDNRFACFVVGDLRDSKGFYCNFVSDTIAAFQDAGLKLYNEMILVTAVGSLPIRVGRQFESGRKVGKTHQNILVFFKGDPKTIADNFPKEIAITAMPEAAATAETEPASGDAIFGEEL